MYNKTKQIFVASLVALTLVGMGCSSNSGGSGGSSGEGGSGGSSSIAVDSVSLNKSSVSIEATGTYTFDKLTATVLPSNATNKNVTWSSDKTAVATVSNGKVTAVSAGTAIITATTTDGNHTATATVTVSQEWNVLDSTINVPLPTAGIKFPMGTNDSGTGTIKHKFALAKTEVTYELWKKVYDWANKGNNTCQSNGQYCYGFANAGTKGGMLDSRTGNLAGSDKQPVTKVNWRDSIVWCNAYTEWYNAEKGGSLSVVYYTDAAYTTPLRTSTNATVPNPLSGATAGSEDKPYIKANSNGNTSMANNTATGFRLPTSQEWEFAARLRTDATNTVANGKPSGVTYPITIDGTSYWFTKGDSASGATKNYNYITETGKFSLYEGNSCDDGTSCFVFFSGSRQSKTQDVGTKAANALGIYDMSGNVWEWCFDIDSGSDRVYRGGSWYDLVSRLQVGVVGDNSPDFSFGGLGFRLARSLP